ncbi:MAG TPA: class I SAM-dependent methyltransferase [Bacteroidales bacterium]|nr:class I SAM-dependent methyltransferase [Bacteroidales bacterium]
MIFFRVIRYLKYLILSRHRKGHGIHSPFVFDLVSRVFRNKIDTDIVCSIEKVRKRLISDHGSIIVKDLGSGAESLKTNFRKVSDIARYSPVPLKYGILLSNMAVEFGNPFIIEFGTSFGISTMYMAASSPDSIIYTMEGCPASADIATSNFNMAGLNNIRIFTGSFDETLPEILRLHKKPGMVFIDGNHRKEPVVNYFRRIVEVSDSKTVIIIDDINYSKEMGEAWNEIKGCKEVSLTVDVFRMGIVFLREGINHNNYIIRY